jgi:hypothetical protein
VAYPRSGDHEEDGSKQEEERPTPPPHHRKRNARGEKANWTSSAEQAPAPADGDLSSEAREPSPCPAAAAFATEEADHATRKRKEPSQTGRKNRRLQCKPTGKRKKPRVNEGGLTCEWFVWLAWPGGAGIFLLAPGSWIEAMLTTDLSKRVHSQYFAVEIDSKCSVI